MGWKGVFVYLLNLASLGESTSRSTQFRPISLSTASSSLYSWAVCIAAIVVVVAFVLSMYLNFVHLAAYNQPEKLLVELILMVPVYALGSLSTMKLYRIVMKLLPCIALRDLIACLVIHIWQFLSFSGPRPYLVQSYSVTKIKLARFKPWAKFLTFKSIVFQTWWQGAAVAFLLIWSP
ncbi:Hypothetical predicted protein [Olea europaea subsp. europaea]|uniref:Uncharacterized protein n=1 Tax=Olea europaea subsp. europaea TaxID=158383 RepID=A0A8S0UK23_OLEEU|nr:Hypothetical predicted protein [Olea europaea subsp. europaea]